MSVIASLIRAGVDPDLVADVAAEIAAARAEGAIQASPTRSAAAERQARYRERQASQSATDHNEVTETVSLKVSPNDNINSNPHPNSHPSVSERDEAFDRLRQAYPKRAGSDSPKQAQAKFQAAMKRGVDPEAMIAGARAYARFMAGSEPKFVKQLQNWITAECWTEDWDGKPRSRAGPRRGDQNGFHTAFNETVSRYEPDHTLDELQQDCGTFGPVARLEHDHRALPRQAEPGGRGPILDLEPTGARGGRG